VTWSLNSFDVSDGKTLLPQQSLVNLKRSFFLPRESVEEETRKWSILDSSYANCNYIFCSEPQPPPDPPPPLCILSFLSKRISATIFERVAPWDMFNFVTAFPPDQLVSPVVSADMTARFVVPRLSSKGPSLASDEKSAGKLSRPEITFFECPTNPDVAPRDLIANF